MGCPIFAGEGGGIAYLLGPTGGYLIGYIVAAYVVGYVFEKSKNKSFLDCFDSLLIGNFVIYFFGVLWLSNFVGIKKAIFLGFLPFIIIDILKIFMVLKLLSIVKWIKEIVHLGR